MPAPRKVDGPAEEEGDGEGVPEGVRRQLSPEQREPLPTGERANEPDREHGEGPHLEAATDGAGSAPDEHQTGAEDLALLAEGSGVEGREAGRAHGRLEEGEEGAPPAWLGGERGGVRPLADEQDARARDQHARHRQQDQARVEGEAAEGSPGGVEGERQRSDSAEQGQRARDGEHGKVVGEGRVAAVGEGEAGVIEGADRVERAPPEAAVGGNASLEQGEEEGDGADRLHAQGDRKDGAYDAQHLADAGNAPEEASACPSRASRGAAREARAGRSRPPGRGVLPGTRGRR